MKTLKECLSTSINESLQTNPTTEESFKELESSLSYLQKHLNVKELTKDALYDEMIKSYKEHDDGKTVMINPVYTCHTLIECIKHFATSYANVCGDLYYGGNSMDDEKEGFIELITKCCDAWIALIYILGEIPEYQMKYDSEYLDTDNEKIQKEFYKYWDEYKKLWHRLLTTSKNLEKASSNLPKKLSEAENESLYLARAFQTWFVSKTDKIFAKYDDFMHDNYV